MHYLPSLKKDLIICSSTTYYISFNLKLTKKVSQIFPGDTIISLQIIVEDIHTDNKISSIEWVDLIPSLDLKNVLYNARFF